MTEVIDFTKNCPMFYRNGVALGGIPIPFVLTDVGSATYNYVDFDGTASTVIYGRLKLKGTWRYLTAEAYATLDIGGEDKSAAASTEPVLTISYGSTGCLSAGDATALTTITCDGAGTIGSTIWTPGTSTTETQIDEGKDIIITLATAAASAASAKIDGGAKVVVWLAPEKAPQNA